MVSTKFGLIRRDWTVWFALKIGKVKPPKCGGLTLRHGNHAATVAQPSPWIQRTLQNDCLLVTARFASISEHGRELLGVAPRQ